MLPRLLMLSRQGEARRTQKLAKLLALAAEAQSICIPCEGLIIAMRSIISMLRVIQSNLKQLFKEMFRISELDETVARNRYLLDTIPGISSLGACILLGEIGDPKAFHKPTQLVAFFGLEPSQHESGTFKSSSNKITKRGSPYVRRLLSMAVMTCVSEARVTSAYNPALAEYYKRKCTTKPKKVAVCAVIHKMVYIIFAVLRDQKAFEHRSAEEHALKLKSRQKIKLIA